MSALPNGLSDAKYSHIISLGYFCSVALELERFGLRDASYPFDWVISSWGGVVQLLNDGFGELFNPECFEQDSRFPEHYRNTQFDIAFYHDFDRWRPFNEQLPEVRAKYGRRIKRLYEHATEPSLFIRYIRDEDEVRDLKRSADAVRVALRKMNPLNELLFIGNEGVASGFAPYVFQPDAGDVVARRFGDACPSIINHLSAAYSPEKRAVNLLHYAVKERRGAKAARKIKRIGDKMKGVVVSPYRHNRISLNGF